MLGTVDTTKVSTLTILRHIIKWTYASTQRYGGQLVRPPSNFYKKSDTHKYPQASVKDPTKLVELSDARYWYEPDYISKTPSEMIVYIADQLDGVVHKQHLRMFWMRYHEGWLLKDIGKLYELSPERIRQILKKIERLIRYQVRIGKIQPYIQFEDPYYDEHNLLAHNYTKKTRIMDLYK